MKMILLSMLLVVANVRAAVEHWPAVLAVDGATITQDKVVAQVRFRMNRPELEDDTQYWISLSADSDARFTPLPSASVAITHEVTLLQVQWTQVRDPALSASNRSVNIVLPRVVAHLATSEHG
jgi:hypothetical protein